jgi:membrane associated rhomboid family serine protease
VFGAGANGGGVAFFAHVGGFVFGVIATVVLTRTGQIEPQDRSTVLTAPAWGR